MLVQHTCSIALLLVSAALAAIGPQRSGWLDRVVQYQKEKLFNEVSELAPINVIAELRPKPEGYGDSKHWDYDSVLRLLTLIRGSETAKPVHKTLRRMLQPTRRLMMSMKESMHRFPTIKKEGNAFYYDVDYTSSEEGNLPVPPPVPEDQVVLVVSNPVEARLPSTRISVKLLRQILEARARAGRHMRSTTLAIPWVEFVKNRNSTTATSTDAVGTTERNATGDANATTVADGADSTTVADGADSATVADGADSTTVADGADSATVADAGGDGGATVPDGVGGAGDTTAAEGATGDGATTDAGGEATEAKAEAER